MKQKCNPASSECAWFGVLVIPNTEPAQTITLGPDEQELPEYPQHEAPIVKEVLAPFVDPQNIAPGAAVKRAAQVRQKFGPLGLILSR
jgi:hypothetical protein